ncbi:MAG TPA: divergent PAP2 family protein [Ruminiclostridium sp.]
MYVFLNQIASNKVLWTTLLAWLIAASVKGVIYFIKEKKFSFWRCVGNGGMPSSHSATVSCLSTAIGLKDGWNSVSATLALIFALVVMIDATGVRQAAGKQAITLNKIIDELFKEGEFHQERLKEFLGHTPLQVITGAILGVVIAIILK